jgi:hypothetical protein
LPPEDLEADDFFDDPPLDFVALFSFLFTPPFFASLPFFFDFLASVDADELVELAAPLPEESPEPENPHVCNGISLKLSGN